MFKTYSNTQRQTLNSCAKKYYYKYIQDLEEGVGAAAQFSVICVHPLIQAIYQHPGLGDWSGFIDALWEEYTSTVGDVVVAANPACSRVVLGKVVKQLVSMVLLDKAEGWNCIGVEVEASHPRVSVGETVYKTRVDILEERGEELRVTDVKFSTRQKVIAWEYENQMVGHAACFGLGEVTLLEVSSEKPTKYKSARVGVTRTPVRMVPDIIEEWVRETKDDLVRLERHNETRIWPKNTQACYDWNRPCPFMRLCEAGVLRSGLYSGYAKKVPYRGGK